MTTNLSTTSVSASGSPSTNLRSERDGRALAAYLDDRFTGTV